MQLCVHDILQATGGEIKWPAMPPRDGEDSPLSRIVTDSRHVEKGDVFWALRGNRHDGADYVQEAFLRGAMGVVADRPLEPWPGGFSVCVSDSKLALWQLAGWHREHLSGTLVAVAGTIGKTTTASMIHAALDSTLRGSACPQSDDHRWQIPLALLTAKAKDDYAVFELDAGTDSDFDALTQLTHPQIGVVTSWDKTRPNEMAAHPSGASPSGAMAFLTRLPSGTCVVLPGDQPELREQAERFDLDVTWFGRGGDCEISASQITFREGRLRFNVCGQAFEVPVWGRHHLHSALAAIAVGQLFGQPMAQVAEALAAFQPLPKRCQVHHVGDIALIDDSYSSDPSATKAALALLREFGTSGRRIAVLGDVCETDEQAESLHVEMGQEVVTYCGADELIACGQFADCIARGARDAGMPAERLLAVADAEQVVDSLKQRLRAGDVLLAKGPPDLERVVRAIVDRPPAQVA